MYFLQATNQPGVSIVLFLGTLGMVVLTVSLIIFIVMHQRKVIRYQNKLQQMEQEQQKILLNASIKLQKEERQRSMLCNGKCVSKNTNAMKDRNFSFFRRVPLVVQRSKLNKFAGRHLGKVNIPDCSDAVSGFYLAFTVCCFFYLCSPDNLWLRQNSPKKFISSGMKTCSSCAGSKSAAGSCMACRK